MPDRKSSDIRRKWDKENQYLTNFTQLILSFNPLWANHCLSEYGETNLERTSIILSFLRKEAKKIILKDDHWAVRSVIEKGLDNINEKTLHELDREGIYVEINEQTSSAIDVLGQSMKLKELIENELSQEEVFLHTLNLVMSACRANVLGYMMKGIHSDFGPSSKKPPRSCQYVKKAIQKVVSENPTLSKSTKIWEYFKVNYTKDVRYSESEKYMQKFKVSEPLEIENYRVYFHDDKIWQENKTTQKAQGIGVEAFKDYLTEIRPKKRKKTGGVSN